MGAEHERLIVEVEGDDRAVAGVVLSYDYPIFLEFIAGDRALVAAPVCVIGTVAQVKPQAVLLLSPAKIRGIVHVMIEDYLHAKSSRRSDNRIHPGNVAFSARSLKGKRAQLNPAFLMPARSPGISLLGSL